MHVSRAVEPIREDPVPGEKIDLVFEVDADADPESVAIHLEAAGATIDRHLQFDDILATVRHEDVAAVCRVDGVDAVQTADAIGIHPDEAEDSAARSGADGASGPATGPRDDFESEQ